MIGELCAICRDELGDEPKSLVLHASESVTQTPHLFHTVCLNGWAEHHPTCPACLQLRVSIFSINGTSKEERSDTFMRAAVFANFQALEIILQGGPLAEDVICRGFEEAFISNHKAADYLYEKYPFFQERYKSLMSYRELSRRGDIPALKHLLNTQILLPHELYILKRFANQTCALYPAGACIFFITGYTAPIRSSISYILKIILDRGHLECVQTMVEHGLITQFMLSECFPLLYNQIHLHPFFSEVSLNLRDKLRQFFILAPLISTRNLVEINAFLQREVLTEPNRLYAKHMAFFHLTKVQTLYFSSISERGIELEETITRFPLPKKTDIEMILESGPISTKARGDIVIKALTTPFFDTNRESWLAIIIESGPISPEDLHRIRIFRSIISENLIDLLGLMESDSINAVNFFEGCKVALYNGSDRSLQALLSYHSNVEKYIQIWRQSNEYLLFRNGIQRDVVVKKLLKSLRLHCPEKDVIKFCNMIVNSQQSHHSDIQACLPFTTATLDLSNFVQMIHYGLLQNRPKAIARTIENRTKSKWPLAGKLGRSSALLDTSIRIARERGLDDIVSHLRSAQRLDRLKRAPEILAGHLIGLPFFLIGKTQQLIDRIRDIAPHRIAPYEPHIQGR